MNRLIALITVGGLTLMSCSGDDSSSDDTATPGPTEPVATEPETTEPETTEPETTEPETTEPETTEPETTEPDHTVELIGCEQIAIYLPVDAAQAQLRVADGAEVVAANDQVVALFLINECRDTAVDGQSGGAARVAAQWLPVPGPDEVRDGPQFDGVPVLPTAYWEPIFTATDNSMLRDLMEAAELEMALVDSMTFDPMFPETTPDLYQGHTGIISNADPVVDFLWITMNPWADVAELPYVDQRTGFVHVVGNLELETVGTIRVADIPACGLANGVIDDAGQPVDSPDAPIQGQPGIAAAGCYLVTYDSLTFETVS